VADEFLGGQFIAPKGELWWDVKKPEQATLWESWIELGEDFFNAVVAAPVPVDMRALRALKQSPLALDLYAWSTYRAFVVSRKGASQLVPWRKPDAADRLRLQRRKRLQKERGQGAEKGEGGISGVEN
jgi:hypothetical protein